MIEKYLLEDEESSFNKKAQRRAIDCERVAKLAREAAKKAEDNNQAELAVSLNQKADELETAAKNWNKDIISSEESSGESSGNNKEDSKKNTPDNAAQEQDSNSNSNNSKADNSEANQNNSSRSQSGQDSTSTENSNEGNQESSNGGTSDNEQSSQKTDSNNNGQGSQEQEENENTEDSSEDDDPVEDIFNTKQQSQAQIGQQGQKEPRKPTLDEIIKQLANLPEKHKQEAILGLKDLLGITND